LVAAITGAKCLANDFIARAHQQKPHYECNEEDKGNFQWFPKEPIQ
jgi:hypothetical protein